MFVSCEASLLSVEVVGEVPWRHLEGHTSHEYSACGLCTCAVNSRRIIPSNACIWQGKNITIFAVYMESSSRFSRLHWRR
jgi:hypothetical protein